MKIDVHWHYFPEEYIQELRRPENPWGGSIVRDAQGRESLGGFHPLLPEMWDADLQVAEMTRRGIDLAAVSPPPTLFHYQRDAADLLPLCRLFNDRIGQMMRAYPGRYAGLALVPLQDTSLAVTELERAMLTLGLRGVAIPTNVAGRNLDDADLLPFFVRAAELGAFVFVHPHTVLGQDRLRRYYLANLIGNPTDTAVAIASLIFGGVYDAAPGLTTCFAHGGGSFAALVGRWQHGAAVRPEPGVNGVTAPRDYLPRIYVDSLTHDDRARRLVLDTLGADHMMLGSDLPFDMGDADPAASVMRMGLPPAEQERIFGETAARLLKPAYPGAPHDPAPSRASGP